MKRVDVLSPENEARFNEIVAEYLEDVERGRPDRHRELLRQYPDLAPALERFFENQEVMGQLADPVRVVLSDESSPQSFTENSCLGDYRIVREVGRGGMGIVYEAEQISLKRRVALKVLPFAATLDSRQLQRFKNEAQTAACLHHTNIVPIYATGSDRGVYFYAMQFIEGHTLAAITQQLRLFTGKERSTSVDLEDVTVAPSPPVPVSPAAETIIDLPASLSTKQSLRSVSFYQSIARLAIQAAEALEHAHQAGVVHRDVKPANLLVDSGGMLWITDFGLAHVQSDTRLTMTGDLLGTLRYMSPEQALAQRVIVDHRTDIYSLGATLYELLALEPIFGGHDRKEILRQIAFEEPKALRRINRCVPDELEIIVMKMLEKDPDQRYATAQELADDLRRFLANEPLRARRPSLSQQGRKWVRRHRPLVYSGLVCACVSTLFAAASMGWIMRDQNVRRFQSETQILEALQVVEPLLRAGHLYDSQLSSAAQRIEVQLDTATDSHLRSRVEAMRSDMVMLAALEEARLSRSSVADNHFDWRRGAEEYEKAFRDYGTDVTELPAFVAAERLRTRTIAVSLAASLDDWSALLLREKEQKQAEHLLAVAARIDSNDWRTRIRSALLSQNPESVAALAHDMPVDQLPIATIVLLGGYLVDFAKYEEASTLLKQSQVLHDDDFWVNHDLGLALLKTKNAEDAIGYLRAAVALRPGSPGARLHLGNALAQIGRFDEARTQYRQAVQLDSAFERALTNLGAAASELGHHSDAIPFLKRARELKRSSVHTQLSLAFALQNAGSVDEAIPLYQDIIRRCPETMDAYICLATCYDMKGQHQNALNTIRQGLSVQQDRVEQFPHDEYEQRKLADMRTNLSIHFLEHIEQGELDPLLLKETNLDSQEPPSLSGDGYDLYVFAKERMTAGVIHQTTFNLPAAEQSLREALGYFEQLVAEVPDRIAYQRSLASAKFLLAAVLIEQNKSEEGDDRFRQAIDLMTFLDSTEKSPSTRDLLASVHWEFGRSLVARNRLSEAQNEFMQSVQLLTQLARDYPPNADFQNRLVQYRNDLKRVVGLKLFVSAKPTVLEGTADLVFGPDINQDNAPDLYVVGRRSNNMVAYDGNTGAMLQQLVGSEAGLQRAAWLTTGPDGALYTSVAPDDQVRDTVLRIDPKSRTVSRFISKEAPGGHGGLKGAKGMSFGPDGNFYIASEGSDEILRFRGATGEFLDVFVKSGAGGLDGPGAVLFGPDRTGDKVGDMYVSSTASNRILVFNGADGSFLDEFVDAVSCGLNRPHDMDFGPDGHLYVATSLEEQRVLRFDGTTGALIDVVIPGGLSPAVPFITFDRRGWLFVANENEHEVLVYGAAEFDDDESSCQPIESSFLNSVEF